MSSKSRKHSSEPARTHKSLPDHASGQGTAKAVHGEVEFAEPSEKDFLEEELKTPKGRSPFVYAFLVLLMIFLTVIFILPSGSMSGWGNQDPVEMRWTDPIRGTHEMRAADFVAARARFETTLENGAAQSVLALAYSGFISDLRRPTDLDIARLLIADDHAVHAGIRISDDELADVVRTRIIPQFGSSSNYVQRLRQLTHIGGVQGYEDTLRRLLRVQRYFELSMVAASLPERDAIETAWHAAHSEFRFEWVAADLANYEEAARAVEPTDAELEVWLASLSEFDQAQYRTSGKFRAEIAGVQLSAGTDLAALHAAYPRPDGWDDAVDGQAFYTQRYFTLYKKPAPEAGADETPPEQEGPSYFTYEEVADRAARDARTFAAMRDWLVSMQGRVAIGEELDLASEAAKLGLTYAKPAEAMSFEEWRDMGGLSSQQVAARIASLTTAAELAPGVAVSADSFVVVRLDERLDPVMPPVAEIRDLLMTRWVEEKRVDLAEQALADLREKLLPSVVTSTDGTEIPLPKTSTTQEEFIAAAQAASMRTGTREWLDRRSVEADDPAWNDPANSLIRANAQLFELAEGELSTVLRPFGAVDALYLVRAAGEREMSFDKIQPASFLEARQSAKQNATMEFVLSGPFSDEALRSNFKVWLRSEEERAKKTAETPPVN